MSGFILSTIKADPRIQNSLLLFLLLLALGLYMYCLVMSVVNVVIAREMATVSSELVGTITELESQFIEVQHTMRKEVALQHGFVTNHHKTFIATPDTALVISRE